jgi:hypothetical protein
LARTLWLDPSQRQLPDHRAPCPARIVLCLTGQTSQETSRLPWRWTPMTGDACLRAPSLAISRRRCRSMPSRARTRWRTRGQQIIHHPVHLPSRQRRSGTHAGSTTVFSHREKGKLGGSKIPDSVKKAECQLMSSISHLNAQLILAMFAGCLLKQNFVPIKPNCRKCLKIR